MNLHRHVITPEQERVLCVLGPALATEGYYLAGGNAIALHLGHRRSLDLDWFCQTEPSAPDRLAERLSRMCPGLQVTSMGPGTLYARAFGVAITFLRYGYSLLEEPQTDPVSGARLAGLPDLAAMKLVALTQRGSRKDFLDLDALGQAGWSLERLLDAYRRKYGVEDVGPVLVAMTYFDDADGEPMPEMLIPSSWPAVKARFRRWVRAFVRESR